MVLKEADMEETKRKKKRDLSDHVDVVIKIYLNQPMLLTNLIERKLNFDIVYNVKLEGNKP